MKKFLFLVGFMLSSSWCCLAKEVVLIAPRDSIEHKHIIPVKVKGWSCLFEVYADDNRTESGILILHVQLDKDGKLKQATKVASNLSKPMTDLYLAKILATWQAIRYDGETPPQITEANVDLKIEHF